MDIFQNIALCGLLATCICMAVKLYCQSVAISGLREFFEEYSNENAEEHNGLRDRIKEVDGSAAGCLNNLASNLSEINGAVQRVADDVEKLKNGIVPDFEAARQAAAATNDFLAGVSNIMGFDPVAAIRKEREGDAT